MYNLEKIFDECAEELCRRVGLEYPPPNGMVYEVDAARWTKNEEGEFIKWMEKHLKKRMPRVSRKLIMKEIYWFILAYSWKYKGEEDERK